MRIRFVVLLVLVFGGLASIPHQTIVAGQVTGHIGPEARVLSDADVDAAIKAGVRKKHSHLLSTCSARPGIGASIAGEFAGDVHYTGGYDVVVSTNAGRIASLAAEAKRLYKRFTRADVGEELLSPAVFVIADPEQPSHLKSSLKVPAPIERIVLRSKVRDNMVAQPQAIAIEQVTWPHLRGGAISGTRALARFPMASVQEFPPGDFDVVLITTAGERRCKVGASDRARLFRSRAVVDVDQHQLRRAGPGCPNA